MPTGQYDRHPGLNDGLPYEMRRCSKCREVKERGRFSPDTRLTPDGLQAQCKACRMQRERDWRAQNAEKVAERARAYFLAHREKATAVRADWKRRHPERVKAYALKSRYGITAADVARMKAEQGNACAICRRSFHGRRKAPHTDHNHVTGKVRGLLCGGCNILVGHIETPGRLNAVLAYLARHAEGRQTDAA